MLVQIRAAQSYGRVSDSTISPAAYPSKDESSFRCDATTSITSSFLALLPTTSMISDKAVEGPPVPPRGLGDSSTKGGDVAGGEEIITKDTEAGLALQACNRPARSSFNSPQPGASEGGRSPKVFQPYFGGSAFATTAGELSNDESDDEDAVGRCDARNAQQFAREPQHSPSLRYGGNMQEWLGLLMAPSGAAPGTPAECHPQHPHDAPPAVRRIGSGRGAVPSDPNRAGETGRDPLPLHPLPHQYQHLQQQQQQHRSPHPNSPQLPTLDSNSLPDIPGLLQTLGSWSKPYGMGLVPAEVITAQLVFSSLGNSQAGPSQPQRQFQSPTLADGARGSGGLSAAHSGNADQMALTCAAPPPARDHTSAEDVGGPSPPCGDTGRQPDAESLPPLQLREPSLRCTPGAFAAASQEAEGDRVTAMVVDQASAVEAPSLDATAGQRAWPPHQRLMAADRWPEGQRVALQGPPQHDAPRLPPRHELMPMSRQQQQQQQQYNRQKDGYPQQQEQQQHPSSTSPDRAIQLQPHPLGSQQQGPSTQQLQTQPPGFSPLQPHGPPTRQRPDAYFNVSPSDGGVDTGTGSTSRPPAPPQPQPPAPAGAGYPAADRHRRKARLSCTGNNDDLIAAMGASNGLDVSAAQRMNMYDNTDAGPPAVRSESMPAMMTAGSGCISGDWRPAVQQRPGDYPQQHRQAHQAQYEMHGPRISSTGRTDQPDYAPAGALLAGPVPMTGHGGCGPRTSSSMQGPPPPPPQVMPHWRHPLGSGPPTFGRASDPGLPPHGPPLQHHHHHQPPMPMQEGGDHDMPWPALQQPPYPRVLQPPRPITSGPLQGPHLHHQHPNQHSIHFHHQPPQRHQPPPFGPSSAVASEYAGPARSVPPCGPGGPEFGLSGVRLAMGHNDEPLVTSPFALAANALNLTNRVTTTGEPSPHSPYTPNDRRRWTEGGGIGGGLGSAVGSNATGGGDGSGGSGGAGRGYYGREPVSQPVRSTEGTAGARGDAVSTGGAPAGGRHRAVSSSEFSGSGTTAVSFSCGLTGLTLGTSLGGTGSTPSASGAVSLGDSLMGSLGMNRSADGCSAGAGSLGAGSSLGGTGSYAHKRSRAPPPQQPRPRAVSATGSLPAEEDAGCISSDGEGDGCGGGANALRNYRPEDLPPPVAVTVSGFSHGVGEDGRRKRVTVQGMFHPDRYLANQDCILYDNKFISRSGFEKAGGSTTAKWHCSIKIVGTNSTTLGNWLQARGLPVLKGGSRKSKRQRAVEHGTQLPPSPNPTPQRRISTGGDPTSPTSFSGLPLGHNISPKTPPASCAGTRGSGGTTGSAGSVPATLSWPPLRAPPQTPVLCGGGGTGGGGTIWQQQPLPSTPPASLDLSPPPGLPLSPTSPGPSSAPAASGRPAIPLPSLPQAPPHAGYVPGRGSLQVDPRAGGAGVSGGTGGTGGMRYAGGEGFPGHGLPVPMMPPLPPGPGLDYPEHPQRPHFAGPPAPMQLPQYGGTGPGGGQQGCAGGGMQPRSTSCSIGGAPSEVCGHDMSRAPMDRMPGPSPSPAPGAPHSQPHHHSAVLNAAERRIDGSQASAYGGYGRPWSISGGGGEGFGPGTGGEMGLSRAASDGSMRQVGRPPAPPMPAAGADPTAGGNM